MTAATGDKFGERRIESIDWRKSPTAGARQGVVAVGNFDGVHLGHAALIEQARCLAHSTEGPVVLVTFDPHPLQLLAPERFQPVLTTADDRAELLRQAGADYVVTLQTDVDLLNLSAGEFFDRILVGQFQAKGIVEGFNFRFGHDRAGSIDTLRELCRQAEISFHIVEPILIDGAIVSSSRVRQALEAGNVPCAQHLMNRPYRIRGVVVEGAKRGRTIGFPTANIGSVLTLIPAEGVYAVRAHIQGRSWPGAANVGPNPTFGEQVRKIEVHLIGFDGDLYGQSVAVDFIQRLRLTQKFAGVAELVEQLKRDVEQARKLAS